MSEYVIFLVTLKWYFYVLAFFQRQLCLLVCRRAAIGLKNSRFEETRKLVHLLPTFNQFRRISMCCKIYKLCKLYTDVSNITFLQHFGDTWLIRNSGSEGMVITRTTNSYAQTVRNPLKYDQSTYLCLINCSLCFSTIVWWWLLGSWTPWMEAKLLLQARLMWSQTHSPHVTWKRTTLKCNDFFLNVIAKYWRKIWRIHASAFWKKLFKCK